MARRSDDDGDWVLILFALVLAALALCRCTPLPRTVAPVHVEGAP